MPAVKPRQIFSQIAHQLVLHTISAVQAISNSTNASVYYPVNTEILQWVASHSDEFWNFIHQCHSITEVAKCTAAHCRTRQAQHMYQPHTQLCSHQHTMCELMCTWYINAMISCSWSLSVSDVHTDVCHTVLINPLKVRGVHWLHFAIQV